MQMVQKEKHAVSLFHHFKWFMWEVKLEILLCGLYEMFYNVKYTFINLMVDANFLIKDRNVSLFYTESIHN